eukprot:GEMP01051090.1.p1 GENE.GEMP01051090.1~~GEMP01051090.1.p1  ORF type:complete len:206 (+),score=19.63 GEMP01051090.1:83-700(+)
MRWFSKEHTFEADWETVSSAFWVKYPNDKQPHVAYIDTIRREIDSENQMLRIRRMIHLDYASPDWYKALRFPTPTGYGIEDSTVDLRKRSLSVVGTTSIGKFVNVKEEYQYVVHPDNPNWTKYTISHTVHLSGFGWFGNYMENSFIERVKDKFREGSDVMASRIASLQNLNWRERQSEWQEELAKMSLVEEKIRQKLCPTRVTSS